MRRLRLGASCIALVLGVVTLGAQGSREAEILAAIKSRVDGGKFVGMVVGTIDAGGKTAMGAYGSPGPDRLPLDADSVFEIGSITKVFTAILLADMVDRGEVSFDDPVSKYLRAGTRVPERGGRKITLLDLSTQTSGLPRMPDNLRPADVRNPYADYSVEQLYDFLGRYELTRDIGSRFEYSNLGVGLLGHALALKAGTDYETLVKRRILDPLGMEHTGVTLTPWMTRHLVQGHDNVGRPVMNWDIPTLAGAGALRSTLNDMLRFARANLEAHDRLQRVMARTHQPRASTGQPDMSIGLNWLIRRMGDGHEIVWHNGGTGGYRTWIGFDASRKLAAVVLSNSTQGADDLGFELLK